MSVESEVLTMDLYTQAATVLDKFEKKQGSVKSLVFASGYKNVRQLYALVCESLKYQSVLTTILKRSHSLQQEEDLQGQGHLSIVLLYEHLLGKGLGRAGPIRKSIVKHKNEIQERCEELQEERGVTSLADLLSSQTQALNKLPIPRYVRVNLLKTTVQDAVTAFTAEGWTWRHTFSLDDFQTQVESLGDSSFGLDPLLSDLLIFPPDTDLHDHPWVVAGCLVLQDRASCFPAHVLNPGIGATVLDCCAAPGNKTSHAASLMGNKGKIWAYERDGKRMTLLQRQLRKLGVSNVTTVHQDFLTVNPHDPQFADVEYILVDPSCSGSGIISRMDHINDSNNSASSTTDSGRLANLQRFQISILKHALRFPSARRVVYSTCSVHQEENEKVVEEVVPQVRGKFEVKAIFKQFHHRGMGSKEVAAKCVRTSPEEDLTNGFFVACFEHISADSASTREKKSVQEPESGKRHEGVMEDSTTESSRKKKRKRKFKEVSEHTDPASGLNCSEASDSVHLNSEQYKDSDESPKKKKKKCKSKKKSGSKEREGLSTPEEGSHETGVCLSVPEMSSICDDPTSLETKSSKGKKSRGLIVKASVKANTQKKGRKRAEDQSSSWHLQPQEPDLLTKNSVNGKKSSAEENSSISHYLCGESDLPTQDFNCVENYVKTKKKKGKKKQHLQDGQLIAEDDKSQGQITDHYKLGDPTKKSSAHGKKKKKKKKKE